MEGVTDAPMRAFFTERGGFDFCVSEFLRICELVPPARVYQSHIPELLSGGKTPSGIPVQVQLLGGREIPMAESARRAVELGAPAIDINFGCPAPTVNRNDGGATLLKFPLRIRTIVEEIRKAVPAHIPVSAKLRLGWDQMDAIHENADRAAEGGASWITIHGRTRMQGYTPPAYWEPIGQVKRRLSIPVVANGEIWSFEDFERCREQTRCEHFMVGRGALADPFLPLRISAALHGGQTLDDVDPDLYARRAESWIPLVERFTELSQPYTGGSQYTLRRVKQWFRYVAMRRQVPWFESIKRLERLEDVKSCLFNFASLS